MGQLSEREKKRERDRERDRETERERERERERVTTNYIHNMWIWMEIVSILEVLLVFDQ